MIAIINAIYLRKDCRFDDPSSTDFLFILFYKATNYAAFFYFI